MPDGDFRPPIIEWSEQQREALDAIGEWCKRGESQTFFLSGVAGAGKSTLAREVSRRIDGKVCFCSVTGARAPCSLVRAALPTRSTT